MEQYNVEGMSCAACVAHVEKAVRSVEGVDDVTVNLLTNSMTVEGTAGEAAICEAVHKAGYSASKKVSDEGLQNFSNSSSCALFNLSNSSCSFLFCFSHSSCSSVKFDSGIKSFANTVSINLFLLSTYVL